MNTKIKNILRKSSFNGKFDDFIFIQEQRKLNSEERFKLRFAPEIMEGYFGVKGVEKISSNYPYWDNTTLSFKKPLLKIVRNENHILEIGCGPAATLTIFVCLNKKNIQATGVDINTNFINTAKTISEINKTSITLIHSEMFNNVQGKFDIIFINPPYVPTKELNQNKIIKGSAHKTAAMGGDSGFSVIDSFLSQSPTYLKKDGKILLGINNKYVDDEKVKQHIKNNGFKLNQEYYNESEIFPKGPMSQIYILEK